MGKSIKKEELSDRQIQEIIEEFINLPEKERESRLLGKGTFKSVYDIPGSEYVLKKAIKEPEEMAREYAVSKRLRDELDLETPLLIARKTDEGKAEPFQIQRKVVPLEKTISSKKEEFAKAPISKQLKNEISGLEKEKEELLKLRNKANVSGDAKKAQSLNKKYLNLFDKIDAAKSRLDEIEHTSTSKEANELLDKISDTISEKGIRGADVHEGNITPKGKIFDLGSWVGYDTDKAKDKALDISRKNVVERTLKSPKFKGKYKIFRSIPFIGTGLSVLGALSAPDIASAAVDAIVPGGVESLDVSDEQKELDKKYFKKLKKTLK